ncbi:hypothetical protein B5S32_g2852 [[Candida] boidinii]|nr:hypothetical protein B5S29_g248 [[Candida] boidinii]OWB78653.1 hypothetical protein B5S32_g2852 [[Candida] boidinii]
MVKSTSISQPLITLPGARLSEGISYNPDSDELLWVDIRKGLISKCKFPYDEINSNLQVDVSTIESVKVDRSVGVIGLSTDANTILCGCKDGLGKADFKNGTFEYLQKFPEEQHSKKYTGVELRANDGSIDSKGNFWIGTMVDFSETGEPEKGVLYKFNSDTLNPEVILTNKGIPNGLNWYNNKMYWTDSFQRTIYEYDWDPESCTPNLESEKVFIDFRKLNSEILSIGEPDGSCIDKDGNFYIALWNTNRVVKTDNKGEILEEFIFPAKRISCVSIGGKYLDTLLVTSADLNLDDENKLASVEGDFGGSIFAVDLSKTICGLPKNKWSGRL